MLSKTGVLEWSEPERNLGQKPSEDDPSEQSSEGDHLIDPYQR